MSVNACNGFLVQNQEWQNSDQDNVLKIAILNLMPNKKQTEKQFLELLNYAEAEIEVTFFYPKTHNFKSTDVKDLYVAYDTFEEIKNKKVDGLIITGAPIEKIEFNQVDYIDELIEIRNWAKANVKQTINECWAAQQGLWQDFDIEKEVLNQKLFGIFESEYLAEGNDLTKTINTFKMPQSRHTKSIIDINKVPKELEVIAFSKSAGPFILQSKKDNQIYISGHPEYQTKTLHLEYLRDIDKKQVIQKPRNYYQNEIPKNNWKQSSQRFYQNWINLIKQESTIKI